MPQHTLASLFARLWSGARTADDTDTGDLGTAFGMEMSLLEAEAREYPPAPAASPASHWLRRRGRIATAQGRN